MRFKIICCGWMCEDFVEQTLRSITEQHQTNFDVCMVDDCSADATPNIIRGWADLHNGGPSTWRYIAQQERQGIVRNQLMALNALRPEPDDVVVWLDLDGDRFAHSFVLDHLSVAYREGALLTYGSYRPVPDPGTTTPATPFPDEVVKTNTYRREMLTNGCHFNHLRTMSGRVVRAIPSEQFLWSDHSRVYEHGADYIFMAAGLELAGGRYKCIDEVLCLYNHANPRADYLSHPAETSACVIDFLNKEPLHALDS